jgi:ribosomal protein S12 methylthiotransferase
VESVVHEVEGLVGEGVKEVILVAQDTTAFGRDRSPDGELPELLRAMDAIGGIEWIRLLYGHPAHVTGEIIATMAEGKHICPYLDLPVQHINPQILEAMRRGTAPPEIRQVIHRIREAIPDIHLRTTVIVGFPGETEERFQELLAFMEDVRFEWLGAFAYSREEGTTAFSLGPGPDTRVVQDRLNRLHERQREITRESLRRWVGREVPVLVEGESKERASEFVGRTPFQAPEIDGLVRLKGEGLTPGEIRRVRITGVTAYDLLGEASVGP